MSEAKQLLNQRNYDQIKENDNVKLIGDQNIEDPIEKLKKQEHFANELQVTFYFT